MAVASIFCERPEPDRREVDDVQAGRSNWGAARDVERACHLGKLRFHECQEVSGDRGDIERAVTLARPHARGTANRGLSSLE